MTSTAEPGPTRLILVYNANSGLMTAMMHTVHKWLRPSTYPCSLCAITYGVVYMHGEWRRFLDRLNCEVVIHHRDDFKQAFPMLGNGGAREVKLPAILIAYPDEEPLVLIPAQELDTIQSARELIDVLGVRLPVDALAGGRGGSGVKAVA